MITINQIKMKEQPVLFIKHVNLNVKDLPKVIGPSFQRIVEYMLENGDEMKEAPYVAYYGMSKEHTLDGNNLTIEVGVPLSAPLEGTADISCTLRPAMDAISVVHQGDYNAEMEKVYADMLTWLKENHVTSIGLSFENYLSDPGVPLNEQMTVITIPFEKE